jgi:hypothetical protein
MLRILYVIMESPEAHLIFQFVKFNYKHVNWLPHHIHGRFMPLSHLG